LLRSSSGLHCGLSTLRNDQALTRENLPRIGDIVGFRDGCNGHIVLLRDSEQIIARSNDISGRFLRGGGKRYEKSHEDDHGEFEKTSHALAPHQNHLLNG
jgi:hypothetical protein